MKKILTILFCFSVSLLAQSNSELIDIGEGGVGYISKNGLYLCGSNYPSPPFLWSETTGRNDIGNVEGEAYGVSNNGIVVGRFRDSSLTIGGEPVLRAGYWANNQWTGFEGIQGVPPLDPQSFTHAYGINSNGTKAVGMVWHSNWRVEACYWSIPDAGIGLLGQVGAFNSRANVISNDGSIIAGWDGESGGPDRRAFYWDPAPHFMGGLDPTYLVGECNGMNSDGNVIVGSSVWPFVWTSAEGMQHVVADSSDYWSGSALAISDNGTIVGYVDPGGFNYQAFIKKPGWSDILYIDDFIRDSLGITSLSNYYFAFASAISADGNRIGISAYPPGSNFSHAVLLTLDTTVPVELSSFTAILSDQTIQLNWTTITEKNNSGFEVQRRIENKDWGVLDFVAGRGTTTEQTSYSYEDDIKSSGNFSYRLKQIDFDGSFEYSGIVEIDVNLILDYTLNQNYPNPFNPSTFISFSIPQSSNVNLSVFNILGEKVATLINEIKDAGSYEVEFNATNLTSGFYIYSLEAGSYKSTKKMLLVK
jgi:uncharacterized membrane protein